jgi:hypothetical protein
LLSTTCTYACLLLFFGQKSWMGTDGNGYEDFYEES